MTITINLKGRLGNQLFQYAAIRNLSMIKGYDHYIDINKNWHGQESLLKYFNIKINPNIGSINYKYDQPVNSYFLDEKFYNIKDNTILEGHFENEKYFEENKETIKNELTIRDNNIIITNNKYITNLTNDGSILIGIHFRRGDLIPQLGYDVNEFNRLIEQYTNEKLELITECEKKYIIIIFTGGFRIRGGDKSWISNNQNDDIYWTHNFIKTHKLSNKMVISPGSYDNNTLIDYDLFSKCDYNIITYPSTYSWMASYVNKKNYKKVYYNTYFNNLNKNDHFFRNKIMLSPSEKFI